jgi:hypothetical protein
LQVKDLLPGVTEMKTPDDLADYQQWGKGDKKPLQTEKPVPPQGQLIVKTIF